MKIAVVVSLTAMFVDSVNWETYCFAASKTASLQEKAMRNPTAATIPSLICLLNSFLNDLFVSKIFIFCVFRNWFYLKDLINVQIPARPIKIYQIFCKKPQIRIIFTGFQPKTPRPREIEPTMSMTFEAISRVELLIFAIFIYIIFKGLYSFSLFFQLKK